MRFPQYLIAAVLFFFSVTSNAAPFNCQSSATTTVPNNGEVFTIDAPCQIAPGELINQGQLTNNSNLAISGAGVGSKFDNFGTYNNNGDTSIINAGFKNGPSGTINNDGVFFLGDQESVINEGLFRNDGQVDFNIGGDVANSGTWISSAGSNIDFSTGGAISNSGDFRVEAGATITNDGFELGLFSQNAGTTLLDGHYSGSGMEINGGKLVGSGSFANGFAVAEPEGLTIQDAIFEVGSNGVGQFDVTSKFACITCTMLFDIANPAAGPSDFLSILANRPTNGTAIFDNALFEFNLLDGYYGATGDVVDLVFAEGGFGFGPVRTNFGMLINDGNTLSLRVPEPGSLALLGLGALALVRRRFRR